MASEVSRLTDTPQQSSRYKAIKRNVYLFLERPEKRSSLFYHISSLILIFGSFLSSVLSTMPEFHNNQFLKDVLIYYEIFLLAIFTVEFILRLWSCGFVTRYQGLMGRLLFLRSFYMVIDIIVITSTCVTAILHINAMYVTILRITRFMQVLRILRVDRQRGDLQLMINVVRQHTKELITCYFVGFIILFAGSYLVYICEHTPNKNEIPDEDSISNMATGLYWAIITLTSVGYGDFSPKTWQGKFVTGIFALIGCAFFALPAGILGSGFALQVDKQKKEKRFLKTRHPAAAVLQICWRSHALEKSNTGPTWNFLLTTINSSTLPSNNGRNNDYTPSEPKGLQELMGKEFTDKKSDDVFYLNPIAPTNKITRIKQIHSTFRMKLSTSTSFHEEKLTKDDVLQTITETETDIKYYKKYNKKDQKEMRPQYRGALRFYMRMKYWLAIKSFKNARNPFVNVQDLMERSALDHIELMACIKEMKTSITEVHEQFTEIKLIISELKAPKREIEI